MSIVRCNRGAAAVEFALVALPVLFFILGIMQTAYIVWVDNLLQTAVNTASRCGAVGSTTIPCVGSAGLNMNSAATTVFRPLSGAIFASTIGINACVTGTYHVTFVFVVNLTITANSCYPKI